jgi:hypothetical protein
VDVYPAPSELLNGDIDLGVQLREGVRMTRRAAELEVSPVDNAPEL